MSNLQTSCTTVHSRNTFLVEYIKDFLIKCAPCSICPKDDILSHNSIGKYRHLVK